MKPRFQKIKFNSKGEPYVVFYGRKFGLNEFMKFDEHVKYYKSGSSVPVIVANGYHSTGLLIEISTCGDSAKIAYRPY